MLHDNVHCDSNYEREGTINKIKLLWANQPITVMESNANHQHNRANQQNWEPVMECSSTYNIYYITWATFEKFVKSVLSAFRLQLARSSRVVGRQRDNPRCDV